MESNPIEAMFVPPLLSHLIISTSTYLLMDYYRFTFQQEDVSIYEFYAEVAGKKIASVCKEKQAAFNTYDDALAGGHGGYLLDKGNGEG